MMKNKKVLLAIAAGIVLSFAIGYYLLFSSTIALDHVTVQTYPQIRISQKEIDKINETDQLADEDGSWFADIWEIRKIGNNGYGNIFELDFHYIVKRHSKWNDYSVEAVMDDSQLSDEEKIFFSVASGGHFSGENFFKGELSKPTYVSLMGCTYDKTEEEIKEIARKIKIKFLIQHKNGRVEEKTIGIGNIGISYEEVDDEDDVDNCKDILGIGGDFED